MSDALVQILDYEARSLALLIQEFKDRPLLQGLVAILAAEVQELENTFWDLFTLRDLATAEGEQLDLLGNSLGEARLGRADPEYRIFIGIRILRNLAKGEPERIIQVVRALTASIDVELVEQWPAKVRMLYDGDPAPLSPDQFLAEVKQVIAAGVGLDLILMPTFPLIMSHAGGDPDPEPIVTGGWGTVTNLALGGGWSSITISGGS